MARHHYGKTLTVHRKGYSRRSYTNKLGVRVKKTRVPAETLFRIKETLVTKKLAKVGISVKRDEEERNWILTKGGKWFTVPIDGNEEDFTNLYNAGMKFEQQWSNIMG